MNRKLWIGSFSPKKPPKYPCPSCDTGTLALVEGATHVDEPAYSKSEHSHDAWDPDWIVERFSMMMKCNDKDCGEVITVAGDTSVLELHEEGPEGYEVSYVTAFRPKSIYPGPPLISTPDDAPEAVLEPLDVAFGLFWIDQGAAAARIRVSLERLLDDKLVPTESVNDKGDIQALNLNSRIQVFEKTNPSEGQTFHALRMVGNLGAHGEAVSSERVLDVLELYEDALEKLYSQKEKKLKEIKEKILASKGKS